MKTPSPRSVVRLLTVVAVAGLYGALAIWTDIELEKVGIPLSDIISSLNG